MLYIFKRPWQGVPHCQHECWFMRTREARNKKINPWGPTRLNSRSLMWSFCTGKHFSWTVSESNICTIRPLIQIEDATGPEDKHPTHAALAQESKPYPIAVPATLWWIRNHYKKQSVLHLVPRVPRERLQATLLIKKPYLYGRKNKPIFHLTTGRRTFLRTDLDDQVRVKKSVRSKKKRKKNALRCQILGKQNI